jgi:SAM-dependent methyltransferase
MAAEEALSAEEISAAAQEFLRLYCCYHRIDLGAGITIPAPMTQEQQIVLDTIPRYVGPGTQVIDIGSRDGLLTIEAVRNQAARVVAVDNDPSDIFTDIVVPRFELKSVEYSVANFLALGQEYESQFDVAIFSGVLYHLRYPFFGLKKVFDLLADGGRMILEAAFIDEFDGFPILFCPIGGESPYEATSVSFFNRKGLKDTIMSLGFTVEEVVSEFTHMREGDKLYDKLPFAPGRSVGNIGRLIWICRKHPPKIEGWHDPNLTREFVSDYWNITHKGHHRKP